MKKYKKNLQYPTKIKKKNKQAPTRNDDDKSSKRINDTNIINFPANIKL